LNESLRLLLVEDDDSLRRTLAGHLSGIGYEVLAAETGEVALAHLEEFDPEIVITDVQMPGISGFELLSILTEKCPDVDVIVFTAYANVQGAIDAIKEGAYDYLVKPVDLDQIEEVLGRCVSDRRARRPGTSDAVADIELPPGRLVGRHPAMMEVYKTVGAVSQSRAPVLLMGETGTGKELVARTIHENSPDADEPFIAVNCAAVPEGLLESELFGHVKGSFTDASADRRGRFELARRGTLFLDEIGDTSLSFQAKLLRVLQEREFYPVGSEVARRTEARVIAATHRPLEQMVAKGTFREDLYFRLQVIEIRVPPLRERRSDIPLLVRSILARTAEDLARPMPLVPHNVMMELIGRDWPGNVRELENVLTRAAVLCRGQSLTIQDVGVGVPANGFSAGPSTDDDDERAGWEDSADLSLDSMEKHHVLKALQATGGNKSAAARILNVSRPRLDRIIDRHGLVF
jgi:two-component system response regulator AtoC